MQGVLGEDERFGSAQVEVPQPLQRDWLTAGRVQSYHICISQVHISTEVDQASRKGKVASSVGAIDEEVPGRIPIAGTSP